MKDTVQLCYTISEAAKLMQVEPHVLRYWEDELGLVISRNSMGHRIYTDDDLKTFKSIQHLKANHISLKDIRNQLPPQEAGTLTSVTVPNAHSDGALINSTKNSLIHENGDKMTQFKSILTTIIKDAMSESSQNLGKDISSQVSDNVRKEIDYLIRQRDEEEEARFKKLDETIRTFQKARQEAATANIKQSSGKHIKFWGKRM